MQILHLLPVLSWLQQPGEITGGMWALALIKVAAMAVFGWLFFWLRSVINRLHTKTWGGAPSLGCKNVGALNH